MIENIKMTPEEARILILEDALIQSYHTIDFLHNCLVNPSDPTKTGFRGYSYEYPEQTISRLENIEKIVKIPIGCYHSRFEASCQSCVNALESRRQLNEAKKVLQIGE